MTIESDADQRPSRARPSLDEELQSPQHQRHRKERHHHSQQRSNTTVRRSEEPDRHFNYPPYYPPKQRSRPPPPPAQQSRDSRAVRRMSSVPELRESHRGAGGSSSVRYGRRKRSNSITRQWDDAGAAGGFPPEAAHVGNRLLRQKSIERGILQPSSRPSTQGSRIASGSSAGSRPGSRNGGPHHHGSPAAPGLKMPLAFNSIARERGFTTGSQPPPSPLPPTTPNNNYFRPPASNYSSNPSSSAPDLSIDSRHFRRGDPPRSHPYPPPHPPPQPPFSNTSSASSSPHNSFAPPQATNPDEIRASFRSALSGSEVNRSSGFTTSSETATDSTAMTVDEAIGMYASDTDEELVTGPEAENRRSKGDSVLGGRQSRQGSLVDELGYRIKGDSVLGGEKSPQATSQRAEHERLLQQHMQSEPTSRVHSSHGMPPDRPGSSPARTDPGFGGDGSPGGRAELARDIHDEEPSQPLKTEQDIVSPKQIPQPPPQPPINRVPPEPQPPRVKEPRDRYGFRKQTQYVSLKDFEEWESRYEETLDRRRKKWDQLLRDSGLTPGEGGPVRFPPKSHKVKRYIRKGIPPEWRGAAWFWYAGGQRYLSKYPGLYQSLVAQGPNPQDKDLIERDLHRTFPDNIYFKPDPTPDQSRTSKPLETEIVQKLRRVLGAFAVYDPKIGYCQSLNFLAGLLLLFMTEEKAFWMLYIMTHTHLPGTHQVNLEGSSVDQWVFMMSVRESLPHIWAKIGNGLDGIEVDLESTDPESATKLPAVTLCTSSWFMSGYIGSLPMESILRVWDCFFYEGSKTLFRIALTILKTGEMQIRAVNDPMEIMQVVQAIPRKLTDAGALIEACYRRRNGFGHISQETIDARREQRRAVYAAERAAMNGGVRASKDDFAMRSQMEVERPGTGHQDIGRKFKKILVKA